MFLRTLVFACACLALPACAGPGGPAGAPAKSYVLVQLHTGPRSGQLPADEQRAAFAGHFANMQRLADERRLLVAGPYGRAKHDPALRGLFILDTADLAIARELAASDPAVQAGVFVTREFALQTAAPLRALLEAELERVAAMRREGREAQPGEGMRTYVLLTADEASRAERALAPLRARGFVLLAARLDGSRAFAVLDATDLAGAKAELAGADLGPHVLDEWFGAGGFEQLAQLADAEVPAAGAASGVQP